MPGSNAPDACRLRRANVCLGHRTPGYSSCEPCREVRNRAEARERKERRADGRCLTCAAKAVKGRRYCKAHLAYYAEYRAAEKARTS